MNLFVSGSVLYLFSCRSLNRPAWRLGMLSNERTSSRFARADALQRGRPLPTGSQPRFVGRAPPAASRDR